MIALPPPELLHRPVAALVRQYGAPTAVATRDDGQHFVFADATSSLTAYIGDNDTDAIVHAIDVTLPSGTAYDVRLDDGATHHLVFGATTSIGARDALAAEAETEGTNFRVFRRSADSDVVLIFDAKTSMLARIVVGDRGALLRMGYLVDPMPTQHRFPYSAPVLKKSSVPEGTGARGTVFRLDVDRLGLVRNVAVVVPSDDAAQDAKLAKELDGDSYVPAKYGGRTIGASVYREVRH